MLRVMRKDLKKFPYRTSIHQSLSEVQKIDRMVMSKVLMEKIQWPPHSQDLSPPDFFLWRYLKGKTYANKPRTLLQLKKNITEVIRGIQKPLLKSANAD